MNGRTKPADFTDSTGLLGEWDALRARLDADGYVFLRGVVGSGVIAAAWAAVTEAMAAHGWFRGDPRVQVAEPDRFAVEPQPTYRSVYHEICRSESFHSVPHTVRESLLEPLLGEEVLIHPRPIGRMVFPASAAPNGQDYTTPAHQDFVSVQGTTNTFTCWVPFHAVPEEMGPLAVAEGSHRAGVRASRPTLGTGGTEVTDVDPDSWRSSAFEAGDVVVFNCLAVHRGLPNHTSRFRLSMDFRFQPFAEPICERSLSPSTKALEWENLYRDWRDDSLKFHWRRPGLVTVPFDPRYEEERNRQAIEYARRGDVRATSALQRMAVHDPDETRRELARSLLKTLGAPA